MNLSNAVDVKKPALSLTTVLGAPKGSSNSLYTNVITSYDVVLCVILETGCFARLSTQMSTKWVLRSLELGIGPWKAIEEVSQKFVIGRVRLL